MLYYSEAASMMRRARNPSNGKPIGNNTRLYSRVRGEDIAYAVRFHDTDVVTVLPDSRYEIRTGGWETNTTFQRINEFAPVGRTLHREGCERDGTGGEWYIMARPKAGDPEPPRWNHIDVPRPFAKPNDPGPEPEHDTTNCIAGREEFYSYQEDGWVWDHTDLKPWEHVLLLDGRLRVRRAANAVLVHTDHRQNYWSKQEMMDDILARYGLSVTVDFKVCPCCAAFRDEHDVWHRRMHGYSYGQGKNQGWTQWHAAVDTYGSEREWREAYRADWRRVVEANRTHKAWLERNRVPLGWVPFVDIDGYPLRKDSEAYFRQVRADERAERRRAREERERQHVSKMARKAMARRERRRQDSFIGRADRVASELRAIRLELADNATSERESGDA